MNIKNAVYILKNAKDFNDKSDFISAARFALNAQKAAKSCRAQKREDVAFSAHMLIAGVSFRIKNGKIKATNFQKSEIGRLLKESILVGWNYKC